MQEIAHALLVWIGAHSTLAAGDLQPPPIELIDPEELATLAHDRTGAPRPIAGIDSRVWGYYDWEEGPGGTIYVVRPEDTPGAERHPRPSDNPVFRERLLHELVHFAQHATGEVARFRCPTQGEWQAYSLGGLYLRQHGVPDPLPARSSLVYLFATCRAFSLR